MFDYKVSVGGGWLRGMYVSLDRIAIFHLVACGMNSNRDREQVFNNIIVTDLN